MPPNGLGNFYDLTQTETNGAVVIFNIAFAFILAAAIVWVWRRTHKGLLYAQSFAITLLMLAPLSATVMMIVKNNLIGAFALLGAFSLIRFRTIMKETRDVAFLFFSLTIGVAVGTNNYAIALIATVFISAALLVLYKWNFGAAERTGFVLTLHVAEGFDTKVIEPLAAKYLKHYELLHASTAAGGNEYAYSLRFNNPSDTNSFMNDLQKTEGVRSSYLITGKETIEY